ncbi:hypothetical protein ACFOG5_09930 [Pedobacter fastidiosus]|uniref:Uncharacterized protein n=1 Tax=Pedobacter fastidiosus TaxID=2765361 RepID=A0ABR7KY48_9SPHI|nr:hypothetical protein [Pedobacter fastidiosus]MBC6112951.1 hypothetical protein [Pedobacter fastidiosus]
MSVSFNDGFFNDDLPKNDRITNSWYSTKKANDSLYNVYDEGKSVGYAIYNKNNFPIEINVTDNFDGEDAIRIALWWKITGKSKNIQKWTGSGDTRRPTYLFSNKKILEKTNDKRKTNAIETITEIFIDDKINYNGAKPLKYKSYIDIDRSFYYSDYWVEEMKKHPLPSSILEQLNNINELDNTY